MTQKQGQTLVTSGLGEDDPADGSISPADSIADLEAQCGQLVDRHGHEHSEAVFRNRSPQAICALGIRRVDDDGGAK